MTASLKLNNGLEMPVVALGTYQSKAGEVGLAVKEAIKIGYRHIDTAMIYFNETEIGQAIKECIAEGVVKREELYITTKLWNDCHHPEDVEWACKESLKKLGLDYIDLYLIHSPMSNPRVNREEAFKFSVEPDYDEALHWVNTWKAMEKLVEAGLTRAIGVSNFNVEQITQILDNCKIVPAVNQIEAHVKLQREYLFEFCAEKGILIQCYTPLGRPGSKGDNDLVKNETVVKVAAAHSVSPSQILLKYLIQRGFIVLPKSVTPQRIKDNFDLFEFTLNDDEMKSLRSLHDGTLFAEVKAWRHLKLYPFPEDPTFD